MRNKIYPILKTIGVNLIVFLFLLMITNWACGIYLKKAAEEKRHQLPNYNNDPEYAKAIFEDYHSVAHTYKPFVEWQMLPYRGKTLTINNEGLREHPGTTESGDSGTVRFFGGSTMWGEGSDDTHTIPALFNKELPSYTVFNHGQLAYNTRQSLDALISLYNRGEKADVVVFYDGVNDAAFLCPAEIDKLPAHRLVPMFESKIFGGKRQVAFTILNNLFTENVFILIRHLRNIGERKPAMYDCVDTGKGKMVAEMMISNWEIAHDLVASRGGRFIAVLQPVAYVGSPRVDHLELDKELGENFHEVYYHLKLLIQQRQYPWILDLTDAFDGNEYIYIDFCHVTENGNQIIASKLSSVLREQTASAPEVKSELTKSFASARAARSVKTATVNQ